MTILFEVRESAVEHLSCAFACRESGDRLSAHGRSGGDTDSIGFLGTGKMVWLLFTAEEIGSLQLVATTSWPKAEKLSHAQ